MHHLGNSPLKGDSSCTLREWIRQIVINLIRGSIVKCVMKRGCTSKVVNVNFLMFYPYLNTAVSYLAHGLRKRHSQRASLHPGLHQTATREEPNEAAYFTDFTQLPPPIRRRVQHEHRVKPAFSRAYLRLQWEVIENESLPKPSDLNREIFRYCPLQALHKTFLGLNARDFCHPRKRHQTNGTKVFMNKATNQQIPSTVVLRSQC